MNDIGMHEQAVRRTWRHTKGALPTDSELMRELVRYAILAPSSHNTQCWQFRIRDRSVSILPDWSRRCPAVDPDDHHLFVSLGCAAENLLQAALASGLKGEAVFEAAPSAAVRMSLEPTKAVASPLFDAIPTRQCSRTEFDGTPLSVEELTRLARAGTSDTVQVLLLTEKTAMENVLEYVIRGNTAQVNDPAFVAELKGWIRFSDAEAVRTGDGLSSRSAGHPSVPRWFGRLAFGRVFTARNENDKYAGQVRSSAGMAVFVSETDNTAHWVEAGRCYERFALQAAALGIRTSFPEPTRRGGDAAAAVRTLPRRGSSPTGPRGAIRPRARDATVTATTPGRRARMKGRNPPTGGTR